ncbi:MAG TPA: hypothetical protein VHG51_01245 [Longimicrobiaceae bacterium]|nr:hypothetical protein [Longimicrobiaceae bacterium]
MSEGAPPPGGNLPARRVSSQELEAIIRRAVEIQSAAGGPDETDGIPEAEVVRIGQELGLEPAAVRRAITDVRGRAPAERGVMAATMGPRTVRAARTVRRPAAAVGMLIEEYLVACEYMVVQRRFPDRTRYVRAQGVGAALGRAFRKAQERHTALDLEHMEVAVSAIDEDTALVELSVDMGPVRAGFAASGVVGGGAAATAIAVSVLVTPIVDPLALVGIPLWGGMMLGMRGIYGVFSRSTHEKLEAFLDRLEHGELRTPQREKPDWRKQLGL